jgi:hypothetical protein
MILASCLGGVAAAVWTLIPHRRPRIAVYLAARVTHRHRRVALAVFSVFFSCCTFSFSFWLVLSLFGYLVPGFLQWLL